MDQPEWQPTPPFRPESPITRPRDSVHFWRKTAARGPALGRHLLIGPNTSFIWVTRVIFHGSRTNLFIWSSPLPPTGLSRIMSIHQDSLETSKTTRHFCRNLIRFGLNASVSWCPG